METTDLVALRLTLSSSLIPLLSNAELDTATLGHRDPGLSTVANDKDVAQSSRELSAKGILNMANVESSRVALTANNDTGSTLVTTTSDHDVGASVHVGEVEQLVALQVESDSVVDTDEGVGVTDRATVVRDNVRNTSSTQLNLLDLEQLVRCLLGRDAVNNKASCSSTVSVEFCDMDRSITTHP